jgi:preprotein translocase subunit SecF
MFALVVGIIAGTYSSIYVAAPLTEWIDTRMARSAKKKKRDRRISEPARAT